MAQRDAFSRSGGRLSWREVERYLNRVPLHRYDREHVESVLKKYAEPVYSRGITKEELDKAMEELQENTRDSVDRKEVERIRRGFLR